MATNSKSTVIGLIVGGALLLTCCCTGVGGIVVLTYGARKVGGELGANVGAALPQLAQAAIMGRWQTADGKTTFDFLADGKLKKNGLDLIYTFSFPDTLEIGPDNGGNNQVNGKPHRVIRYRATFRGEAMFLIETDPPPGAQPDAWTLQCR